MVHYLALTSLGAIPVLVNGAMKPEIAIRFIGRIGVKAVYTDTRRHAAISADADESCGLLITDAIAAGAEGGWQDRSLPSIYPYRHAPGDPVLICHSSGTTGMPKAITLSIINFLRASAPG